MLAVEECLERAFFQADAPRGRLDLSRFPAYNDSYRLAYRVLRLDLDVPLAAVQGPPGSGKTYIVELLAEDYIVNQLLESNELIFYIAPTNELVFDACVRVLAAIFRKVAPDRKERCRWARGIPDVVRVLGYRIKSSRRPALQEICGDGIDAAKMVDLKIDENVRLVFSTEFQRPYIEDKGGKRPIKVIVDESSKSPYFRALIPMVRRIAASQYKDFPEALVALGDPQQAISITEYGRDILLMNVVKRKLKEHKLEDRYKLLDVTFRLPEPSHEPISAGYYGGLLKALEDGSRRLSGLNFDSRNVLAQMNKYINVSKTEVQRVVSLLEEAINSKIPLAVLDVEVFKSGDTLDETRAKLGFYATLALYLWSKGLGGGLGLAATSIYSDMSWSIDFQMGRLRLGFDNSYTVQAMIGGEQDFVVTMLGKEYAASDWAEMFATLYAREPELLNVQLSRHRRLLVAIGCVECLKNFSLRRGGVYDERISNTGKKMVELIEGRRAVYGCFKQSRCLR
jgi:hypothetical protein